MVTQRDWCSRAERTERRICRIRLIVQAGVQLPQIIRICGSGRHR